MKPLLTSIAAAVLLSACGSSNHSNTSTTATSNSQDFFQGIWLAPAYGEAVVIDKQQVSRYAYTQDHCIQSSERFALDEWKQSGWSANAEHMQLYIQRHGSDDLYNNYQRAEHLPTPCDTPTARIGAADYQADMQRDLDWLIALFNEYYVGFSLRNLDGEALGEQLYQRIINSNDEAEQVQAIADYISALNDDHVGISFDDGELESINPRSLSGKFVDEYRALYGEPRNNEQLEQYLLQIQQKMALNRYQAAADPEQIQITANNKISWYITADNIGVLIIDGMYGFSAQGFGVSEDSYLGSIRRAFNDLDNIASTMPKLIEQLKDTDSLVIDVRLNGGGIDAVSQVIARHFLDHERELYRKYGVAQGQQTPMQHVRLKPAATTYTKPIALLTSANSVSATEIFILMMRELPHVTLIGEASAGALSNVLNKELPNGMTVNLVNEVYLSNEGIAFEGKGIEVDLEVPWATLAEREQDIDQGLLSAINWLTR